MKLKRFVNKQSLETHIFFNNNRFLKITTFYVLSALVVVAEVDAVALAWETVNLVGV